MDTENLQAQLQGDDFRHHEITHRHLVIEDDQAVLPQKREQVCMHETPQLKKNHGIHCLEVQLLYQRAGKHYSLG
jgi:hypothetical protein